LIQDAIKGVGASLSSVLPSDTWRKIPLWPILACACAYVISILISLAPIVNVSGFVTHFPISTKLTWFGRWLPLDIFQGVPTRLTLQDTAFTEWMILLVITFAAYGLCAIYLNRYLKQTSQHFLIHALIWAVVLMMGGAYIFTSATPGNDVFSYASYGRLLSVYFVNPYFVPPSAFPQDVIYQWLYWKTTVSVYGPIWMVICAFLTLLGGSSQMVIVVVFRCFAILCHMLNILLVMATLREMGRSKRIVVMGGFLYAWNPLALMESALGGHNDVTMLTFLLLGIYWCARAERRKTFLQWRGYIPPIIAFTLATLVKFSAAPALVVLVIAVFFATSRAQSQPGKLIWKPALRSAILASATCAVVALGLYGPFWVGHSFAEIAGSFTSQPSADSSINSILSTFAYYNNANLLPPILNIFKSRKLWSLVNVLSILGPIVIGSFYLWRAPTTRNIVIVTIAALSGFLLTTPWFFSWYLLWIVGLIPLCLPLAGDRFGRALFAFVMTFSATSFLSYYTTMVGWMRLDLNPPQISWSILINLGIAGVPLLVCVVVWRYVPLNISIRTIRIPSVRIPFVHSPLKV
jgi:hypothetical protein